MLIIDTIKFRWFFIKDNHLGYMDPGSEIIREVMLFDKAFRADVIVIPIGQQLTVKHGVLISNYQR